MKNRNSNSNILPNYGTNKEQFLSRKILAKYFAANAWIFQDSCTHQFHAILLRHAH